MISRKQISINRDKRLKKFRNEQRLELKMRLKKIPASVKHLREGRCNHKLEIKFVINTD